jgi:hypothetical protein
MEDSSQLRFHGMSLQTFRRVWITLTNLMCLGLLSLGFLQEHELSNFHGATRPSTAAFEQIGALVGAALLLLGILLEWRGSTWPALIINAGFFAVFGFGVLGEALLMVLTEPSAQYDPEAGLALAIVGIPFTVVALADGLLYWFSRPAGGA